MLVEVFIARILNLIERKIDILYRKSENISQLYRKNTSILAKNFAIQ
jgi:hypothetical protein